MQRPLAQFGIVHGSGFEVVDGTYRLFGGSLYNAAAAAQLLTDGSIERVVCSGRGPVEGENYGTSEAQLMADYLIAGGINSNRIEIEDKSTSSFGNWARSASILDEANAETVLGIAASVCVGRFKLIGDFVASKSSFELVGYTPSNEKTTPKGFTRELLMRNLTRHFLGQNPDISIDALEESYEKYKAHFGLVALKKFIHRGTAQSPIPS